MYFSFSKKEYNGLLTMFVLLAGISILPDIYKRFWPGRSGMSPEEYKGIQQLELVMDREDAGRKKGAVFSAGPKKLFSFDPNLIDASQWQQLGLSGKQAAAIINYRSKGGRFRRPEDLKKMYTISGQLYKELAPYIHIGNTADSLPVKRYASSLYPKRILKIVELNSADTLELDEIKGVGPAFARRIFKYRKRLGGFVRKEQLLEVFGMDSLRYNEIKDQVAIDMTSVAKIDINTATYEMLKDNPYLKYKQINAIIQFRKQHGNYGNIADLKKVAILSDEIVEKLAPYISF